jgi:predicted RNA-binding protein associated with RNAse of E/G family
VIIDKVAGIDYCGGKDFDLLEYFLRWPAFASEMEHYDLLKQYDRYIIFKRRPDDAPAPSADQ